MKAHGAVRKELVITGNHDQSDRKPQISSSSARIIQTMNKANKKKNLYGSLFKKDKNTNAEQSSDGATKIKISPAISISDSNRNNNDGSISQSSDNVPEEGSEEYWNQQRMKLGLKPLFK